MTKPHVVRVNVSEENNLFYATSPDDPGLIASGSNIDILFTVVKSALQELTKVRTGDDVDVIYAKHKEQYHFFVLVPTGYYEVATRLNHSEKHKAHYTVCYHPSLGYNYYFSTNSGHTASVKQRHVTAVIDIAPDGTLAGVELIDDAMPPPPIGIKPDTTMYTRDKDGHVVEAEPDED